MSCHRAIRKKPVIDPTRRPENHYPPLRRAAGLSLGFQPHPVKAEQSRPHLKFRKRVSLKDAGLKNAGWKGTGFSPYINPQETSGFSP
jgi:hypothetical protein